MDGISYSVSLEMPNPPGPLPPRRPDAPPPTLLARTHYFFFFPLFDSRLVPTTEVFPDKLPPETIETDLISLYW